MTWDLRHGRWQDVLRDVDSVSCVVTDPPYSSRTHEGHNGGDRNDGTVKDHGDQTYGHRTKTAGIAFDPISDEEILELCTFVGEKCRGWSVIMCDHVIAQTYERHLTDLGRYVFAPIPVVGVGSRVRLSGDGPSCWTCWAIVSRPRRAEFRQWGTLRGAFVYYGHGDRLMVGGKRLDCMRDFLDDYSRPGDTICDPFSGSGTTLLAAVMEGRNAIGAEMDAGRYAIARKRLEAYDAQPQLPGMIAHTRATQATLDLTGDNK